MTPVTEITVVGGARCRVQGGADAVEAQILDAARGALMEFVWLTDADSGQRLALNPEHIVSLRAE